MEGPVSEVAAGRAAGAGASLGGASGAVAASAHAGCGRFRGTDPLIVGRTRRRLAMDIGFPDSAGTIPDARWMRAMTFERLVRDKAFASEVTTTAVGRLNLSRPTRVVTANAGVSETATAELLADAHARAIQDGDATLIYGLAVPFPRFEGLGATSVRPDFAIVAPRTDTAGSWVIVGDAKDYERMRSRIEDTRLLKGFLQVAVGAESLDAWSQLPDGMTVHPYGVLAVPRNAFLQPEPLVELLDDHRSEVRQRIDERIREAEQLFFDESTEVREFVAELPARFDPATCPTCPLFNYCRTEIRNSDTPTDLLVELGVASNVRPHVAGLVEGSGILGRPPESIVANVMATLTGVAQFTGQRRTDAAGLPGTINVVIAKSDAAALGVYGVGLQLVTAGGRQPWQFTVFDEPQMSSTRRELMRLLGEYVINAMREQRIVNRDNPSPIHIVVSDSATADVLVSIADNLAGIELSRLRWERDLAMGRDALTYNGELADIPGPLNESTRTAVSFLLEEDRARAMTLRSPIVDVRAALARHLYAGGPTIATFRLDYLVGWAKTIDGNPIRPRDFEDDIESREHTPGARLTSSMSNAIHAAMTEDPDRYVELVTEELSYKCAILESALDYLDALGNSALREVYRAIEGDSQAVWRRRLQLHASDLVRFGRTYRHWRNSLVPSIESDALCRSQLLALVNPEEAADLAIDAGVRHIANAIVVDTDPLTIEIDSRRIGDGSRIVLLHVNGQPTVEAPGVTLKMLKTGFKFDGLSIGPLTAADDAGRFVWDPYEDPGLSTGDRLVIGDFKWFCNLSSNKSLKVSRPTTDTQSAPKPDCYSDSFVNDPDSHRFCCRPHEDSEAEWSDELAARRARGELNPDTWPPVIDRDAFEVSRIGAPTGERLDDGIAPPSDDLTLDDVD